MRAEVPEPWAAAMVNAGAVDPRTGAPSMSGLARAVGVHTSTISAMIWGRRETDSDTVNLVAERLRLNPVTVFEWVGRARTESEPFKPHPDADLLDKESRVAVNELIRLLARNQKAGGDRSGDSAATTKPAVTLATGSGKSEAFAAFVAQAMAAAESDDLEADERAALDFFFADSNVLSLIEMKQPKGVNLAQVQRIAARSERTRH